MKKKVQITVDEDLEKAIKDILGKLVMQTVEDFSKNEFTLWNALDQNKKLDGVSKFLPYILTRPEEIKGKPGVEKQLEEWEQYGYPEEFFAQEKKVGGRK